MKKLTGNYFVYVFNLLTGENEPLTISGGNYEYEIHLYYNNTLVADGIMCNYIYFELLGIDSKTFIFEPEAQVTEKLYITKQQYWTIKNFE